ncbi:MAG: SUMF1/EgtB/PvdO family nonheme iron enzyme [Myxococcota bacterium]
MGNSFDDALCNIGGADREPDFSGVFARCRSGFGVADMAGNVAEWTTSRWSNELPDKVVRGGSAQQAYYTARCAARAMPALTTVEQMSAYAAVRA